LLPLYLKIKKEGNMKDSIKSTVLMLVIGAFTVQLGGCIFVDRDRERHDHRYYHEEPAPGIDVHLHGG
jgi:hypothetical protein